jgi:ergothioneine biosynthesis protein EgtB
MGRLEDFRHSFGASEKTGNSLIERYFAVRKYTEFICEPLVIEDYVVQPAADVSPPKWHLAHTTWFFEEMILAKHLRGYKRFHPRYAFLFNSYYESVGEHVLRPDRGNMSRPTIDEIHEYRAHVDQNMIALLGDMPLEATSILEVGMNHEQQHQELLYTDIKYILGHNPLYPIYHVDFQETPDVESDHDFIDIPGDSYSIGNSGKTFSYDHEQPRHDVYLNAFSIRKSLVTNAEYMEFMENGGYLGPAYWLNDGWLWVNENKIQKPLYWLYAHGTWYRYAMSGLEKVNPNEPVTHISFYEAAAFAEWKGMRLPTEFEWEAAAPHFNWGLRWEHTQSAFGPYPGYRKPDGALGEYNAKFMVNTMVLRGGSVVTPANHTRLTYRNFFYAHLRWQFNGIRLCKRSATIRAMIR